MIASTLTAEPGDAGISTSLPTDGHNLPQSGHDNVHHPHRAQSLLAPSAAKAYADVAQELLQKERHESRISEARDVVKKIGEIKEAFEIVRRKWSDLSKAQIFKKEQIEKYYADWKRLSEEFGKIALETSRVAAQGATIIKDFSDSFLSFLEGDKATVEQKQEQLTKFKEKLNGEETKGKFGIGDGNMYALAERINRLRMDVLDFEFSMRLHGISGNADLSEEIKALETKIKELEKEVAKMEDEHVGQSQMAGVIAILTMLDNKHATPTSVEVGRKLADNGHVLQQDERRKLKRSIREHKETLKQKMDGQNVQHDKIWDDHLRTCEEQITSISDHLCAVSMVWTALCADTTELDTQLGLVTGKGPHEELFRRRLQSTIDMYTRLYEVLSELARGQPNGRPSAPLRPAKSMGQTEMKSESAENSPLTQVLPTKKKPWWRRWRRLFCF